MPRTGFPNQDCGILQPGRVVSNFYLNGGARSLLVKEDKQEAMEKAEQAC